MLVRQRLGDRGTCCPLFVTSQAGFLSEPAAAAVAVQGGRRDKGADKKEISNRSCDLFLSYLPTRLPSFPSTPFWPSFAKPFLKNTGPVRETTPGQHHRTNKERKADLGRWGKHSEKPIFATVSPGLQSRSRRGRLREKPGYKSQCLCCSFFYL